jgi:hypothetical protein
MTEYLVQGSIDIAHGGTLRIEDGRDIVIYVWHGRFWVGEEGERRDHVLKAGDWLRLKRNGVAIGYALAGGAVVTLTAPRPEHYARRIAMTPAGSDATVELYDSAEARKGEMAARVRRLWAKLFAPQARPTSAAL